MFARLFLLFVVLSCGSSAPAADPQTLVAEAVAAVGGPEKLLRQFRMKERYHSGTEPMPPAGKTSSTRESILDAPAYWWIGKKDRTDEPAKFDVWAWTLVALTDVESKIESVPDLVESEKTVVGLRVSDTIVPPLEMYFDAATKLIVRMDWRNDIYRFSEWREHDGVKYAARTVIYRKTTGKPWFFHEITELERLKELPAGLPR